MGNTVFGSGGKSRSRTNYLRIQLFPKLSNGYYFMVKIIPYVVFEVQQRLFGSHSFNR